MAPVRLVTLTAKLNAPTLAGSYPRMGTMAAKVTRLGTEDSAEVDVTIESADNSEATLVGPGCIELRKRLAAWGSGAREPVQFDVVVGALTLRRCQARSAVHGAIYVGYGELIGKPISARKSVKTNELRRLIDTNLATLRAAHDALVDIQTYSKPQLDGPDTSGHDFVGWYNQRTLAAERALEQVGIDPVEFLSTGKVARDVNVIKAATHIAAWGEQILPIAISKLAQGISEWAQIEKDHSLYNPSELRKRLEKEESRRFASAHVPWSRADRINRGLLLSSIAGAGLALISFVALLAEDRGSTTAAEQIVAKVDDAIRSSARVDDAVRSSVRVMLVPAASGSLATSVPIPGVSATASPSPNAKK